MRRSSISASGADRPSSGLPGRILHEDNHLLVVNKLPSELVQGDRSGDEPLVESLKSYLKHKYDKAGAVFLGVVHRIDRPVSGVVLFARTSKALARLNLMLKERQLRKTYLAVVGRRPPEDSGSLVHHLRKNERQNKSYVVEEDRVGAKRAELRYTLLAQSERYFLLELELLTGRHHQIRAQLAAMGCPIRGDMKYGFDRPNKDGSIHLHARSLSFEHPVRREPLSLTAPFPTGDPLWEAFKRDIVTKSNQEAAQRSQ